MAATTKSSQPPSAIQSRHLNIQLHPYTHAHTHNIVKCAPAARQPGRRQSDCSLHSHRRPNNAVCSQWQRGTPAWPPTPIAPPPHCTVACGTAHSPRRRASLLRSRPLQRPLESGLARRQPRRSAARSWTPPTAPRHRRHRRTQTCRHRRWMDRHRRQWSRHPSCVL